MRRTFLLVAGMCLTGSVALAQDPAKVDPQHCKVEFENAQVRVLRWHTGPHEKIPMHEHPAYVGISLTDQHTRLTLPDGKTEEVKTKAGQTSWNEPQKHSAENLSDSASENIQVELKGGAAGSVALAQDPAQVDPQHSKVEFENAQVRVLHWHTGPHEKVPMHEHPAYVAISLTDSHIRYTLPDGTTKEVKTKAGETSWNEPQKHSAENLSDSVNESIQVELKGKGHAPAKKRKT